MPREVISKALRQPGMDAVRNLFPGAVRLGQVVVTGHELQGFVLGRQRVMDAVGIAGKYAGIRHGLNHQRRYPASCQMWAPARL